jgi:hypothetical protein
LVSGLSALTGRSLAIVLKKSWFGYCEIKIPNSLTDTTIGNASIGCEGC